MNGSTSTHPTPIALIPYNCPESDPVAFMCPTCRSSYDVGNDPDWARSLAARCCSTVCDTCGGPKRVNGYCGPCQQAREAAKDAKTYAEATKITEWAGPVYSSFTDRFYAGVGEALEAAERDGHAPPPYLWPCDSDTAHLDPDAIVEGITEEMHEDYEVDAYAELAAFCVEWNAKQTGATWRPNYASVVVIGDVGAGFCEPGEDVVKADAPLNSEDSDRTCSSIDERPSDGYDAEGEPRGFELGEDCDEGEGEEVGIVDVDVARVVVLP